MALTASNIATCIIARLRVAKAFGSCFSVPIATPLAPHSVTTSAATAFGRPIAAAVAAHTTNAALTCLLSMIFLRAGSSQAGSAPTLQTREDERGRDWRLEGFVTRTSGFHLFSF